MDAKAQDETSSSSNISYSTKKIFEECSFTWTIENLSFMVMEEKFGYSIKSPTFPSSDNRKCKWEMSFYPCGFDENSVDLVVVTLSLKSATADSPVFKTKCTFSFYDAQNSKLETLSLGGIINEGKRLDARLNREILFKKRMPEADILKIKVDIRAIIGESSQFYEKEEYFDQAKPELELIDHLSIMFMEQTFSDVQIVVKETEFQAHQNIIAARSPVLGAMLKNETKEKIEKRIIINDMDPEIMQKLLRFMYTSIIEFANTDEASMVLIAADKYCLEGLKKLTEEYLSSNINTSNALDILNVADVHTALQLKSRAIDFICKNKVSFSSASKYTQSCMKNLQLLVDILDSSTCINDEMPSSDKEEEI